MSEPTFAVPLSALVEVFRRSSSTSEWSWSCIIHGREDDWEHSGFASSESEARSAAVEHLAAVHKIRPLAEDGATCTCTGLPQPEGPCTWCDVHGQPSVAWDQGVDSGRQQERALANMEIADLRAEVARLRSADKEER